jgi:hypothetical protein
MNPVMRARAIPTTRSVISATLLRVPPLGVLRVEVMGPAYPGAVDDMVALERVIDLPRSIVWDALVDPVLVEGWLHPIARLVDNAEVRERVEPGLLAVSSETLGELQFELAELTGGTRGTSTRLRVQVGVPEVGSPSDPRLRDSLSSAWVMRLDQLQELLRGHPVDWASLPPQQQPR